MSKLRLSAATLALIGCGVAHSDDESTSPTTVQGDPVSAASRAAPDTRVLWSDFASEQSSLLPQARAVFAALRIQAGQDDELAVSTVTVNPFNEDRVMAPNGDCRVMANPGSRIMEERCYFPSPVEQALNEYQYREEIRYMREEALRKQMREQAERDAARERLIRAGP